MSPDPGLCGRCERCSVVVSARGSTFYRCRAPGRPKYPPLPVLRCEDYTPAPRHDDSGS